MQKYVNDNFWYSHAISKFFQTLSLDNYSVARGFYFSYSDSHYFKVNQVQAAWLPVDFFIIFLKYRWYKIVLLAF